jgi:hypothetical protein
MSNLMFKSLRQHIVGRDDRTRRQRVRSCPRLEQLEERIVMSTFRVNTTLDTVAVDLRSGKDASGHISLRSAIMAANARGGSNSIKLPSGVFQLTIGGTNEDASATGDLDIKSNVAIKGSRSSNTIIDGNNLDRVIQVFRRHHPERTGRRGRRIAEQRWPGVVVVGDGCGE